ncbi:MAG TPA: hypothetical protein VND92_06985 [Vicinamibacterales bacterium]|nr:hypothetical protein [Vicinamibacterales bacterium]
MMYSVHVVNAAGAAVAGMKVEHQADCAANLERRCTAPGLTSTTDNNGNAGFSFSGRSFPHFFQCGPTSTYSWGGARVPNGWAGNGTAVTITVTPLAAQQPAGGGAQPAAPAPAPADEEPADQGTAPAPHPILVAHVCGAPCTSKEGDCLRHTKNDGGCYQHSGYSPGHAEAA